MHATEHQGDVPACQHSIRLFEVKESRSWMKFLTMYKLGNYLRTKGRKKETWWKLCCGPGWVPCSLPAVCTQGYSFQQNILIQEHSHQWQDTDTAHPSGLTSHVPPCHWMEIPLLKQTAECTGLSPKAQLTCKKNFLGHQDLPASPRNSRPLQARSCSGRSGHWLTQCQLQSSSAEASDLN